MPISKIVLAAGQDFRLTGSASATGFPPILELCPRQGQVTGIIGCDALNQRRAKVRCTKCIAPSVEEGKLQEFLSQQFYSDSTMWWDYRRTTTPQPPDCKHSNSKVALWLDNLPKPGWVDWEPAIWDYGMDKPSESMFTSGGDLPNLGAHEGYLEVPMPRKLCEDGRIEDAVYTLHLLVQRGCHVPNNFFYRVLKRCIVCKDLDLGRRIHALTITSGYEGDAFLATHLIGLYASLGRLEEAMGVFTKVRRPSSYNWAAIIFACARHGNASEAIRLYRQMRESTVKPTGYIYVAVLKACAACGDLAAGKEISAHIIASPGQPNIFVQTGLVDMYAKCGSLEDARRVFDGLSQRDVVTWNALFAGYAHQGMGHEALNLYLSMQQERITSPDSFTFACLLQACASIGVGALDQGKQLHSHIEAQGVQHNGFVGTCLIDMYAKCGSLEDARRVFDTISDRDVVNWTVMIAGYAQQGMGQDALSLYRSMQQDCVTPPDSATFVCLIQACAVVAALPLGKQLHANIVERGLQADVGLGAALVNMYGKCGSVFDSQLVFDSLPERTIEAWNALIGGYTRQGDSDVVFDLIRRMRLEFIQPDGITLLSVLTVCSHVGLVASGLKYFEAMNTDYGISATIEHYTCMMDLLGRAGYLDEALQMAKTMPFSPDRAVWLTLLGSCRKWNNVEIGQQAFEFAVTVDSRDAASCISV